MSNSLLSKIEQYKSLSIQPFAFGSNPDQNTRIVGSNMNSIFEWVSEIDVVLNHVNKLESPNTSACDIILSADMRYASLPCGNITNSRKFNLLRNILWYVSSECGRGDKTHIDFPLMGDTNKIRFPNKLQKSDILSHLGYVKKELEKIANDAICNEEQRLKEEQEMEEKKKNNERSINQTNNAIFAIGQQNAARNIIEKTKDKNFISRIISFIFGR